MKMKHEVDPKKQLFSKVESYLNHIKITGSQVLLAIYVKPQKTSGGIILSDKIRDEDRWQGKVGLVLKHGVMVASEEDNDFFGDIEVKVCDWVVFRPADGFPLVTFNERYGEEGEDRDVELRLLSDRRLIKAVIEDPDSIW